MYSSNNSQGERDLELLAVYLKRLVFNNKKNLEDNADTGKLTHSKEKHSMEAVSDVDPDIIRFIR